MKQIITNYTFDSTGKTVTLTDFNAIRLDRLQLITNNTTNTVLYNFADSSVSAATVASNVVTLNTVGGASSTDKLSIIYDTVSGDPNYSDTFTREYMGDIKHHASDFAQSKGVKLQVAYEDNFSEGFMGWQYQFDTQDPARNGLTLTSEARMGNYALQLHTKPANNDGAWARKGMTLPHNLKKIVFGCYFSMHGVNQNNPGQIVFDLDTQIGTGTGTGTNRYFFAIRYLNYQAGLLQKWQVQTGTATAQAFTDISGGAVPMPWNESIKPMLNHMVMVIDFANKKYDHLYINGNRFDLSGMSGPTASPSLTNFDQGLVSIIRLENRNDAPNESLLTLEKPFMAWGF